MVVGELWEYPVFSKLLTRRIPLVSEADHLLQPLRVLVPADTLAGCTVGVPNACAYFQQFWKICVRTIGGENAHDFS